MVSLDTAMTSSYRLSTVTVPLSAVVWPQFWMQHCCLQPSSMCAELLYRIPTMIVAFDIAVSVCHHSVHGAAVTVWNCFHSMTGSLIQALEYKQYGGVIGPHQLLGSKCDQIKDRSRWHYHRSSPWVVLSGCTICQKLPKNTENIFWQFLVVTINGAHYVRPNIPVPPILGLGFRLEIWLVLRSWLGLKLEIQLELKNKNRAELSDMIEIGKFCD